MKRPQGNSLVLAVLRSPAHRLLSGMAVELRYTGRRSGRVFAPPLQYARGRASAGPTARAGVEDVVAEFPDAAAGSCSARRPLARRSRSGGPPS